jgi:Raf kinase inhibitor-like YbhB/YbcL family protein
MNDGRESGYTGPCPPKGDAPHHYHFKLYAVDVDALDVPSGARVDEAEAEAKKHQTAMATLTATYQRK